MMNIMLNKCVTILLLEIELWSCLEKWIQLVQGKGNIGGCSAEFTETRDQTTCGMLMAMISYGPMDLKFMVALMG